MKNFKRHLNKSMIVMLLTASFIFMSSCVFADELIELEFGNEALEEYMTFDLQDGFVYTCLDESIASVEGDVLKAVRFGDTWLEVRNQEGDLLKTIEVIVYFVGDELTPWSPATINKPYLMGYPDKSFKPKNYMTRAELATVFTGLLDLTYESPITYIDTQKSHWGYDAIASVVENNLMKPRLEDEFYPDAFITRQEMALVISNFAKLKNIELIKGDLQIEDVLSNHPNYEAIQQILHVNLMTLKDNFFYPNDFVKREEVIEMVNEMTCLKLDIKSGMRFSDVPIDSLHYRQIHSAIIFTP